MSIEEHLEALTQRLDMVVKIHLESDREYWQRMEKMDEEREERLDQIHS